MLSDNSRKMIFGLALESTFESGDFMPILREVQDCDFPVALHSFRIRWDKIVKIMLNVGAWVTRYEALELLDYFMKHHQVVNDEIWREAVETDQTVYLWGQYEHLNRIASERAAADQTRKTEIDRLSLIRAIISSLMIDTRILQENAMLKREGYIFQTELILAAKKMASYHVEITADEFKQMLQLEFPKLPSGRLHDVDKVYEKILSVYQPVIICMPDPEPEEVKEETATAQQIMESVQKLKTTREEEALVDDLFNSIQLPPMDTKEQITIEGTNGSALKVEMHPTMHEVSAEGIIQTLLGLISEFSVEEIQERAMEELRNYSKHGRNLDKMEVYWEILKLAEKKLLRTFHELKFKKDGLLTDNEVAIMNKRGKLCSAISMYKIQIGNDQKILGNAKWKVKIQG